MPLPIPVLDDRTFHDLVDEARALIPTHAPEWTNHNPSDPGMTLIELFAHVAESLIYRLDQVPPENVCAFLNLLDPSATRTPQAVGDLDAEVARTVRALRRTDRAVTAEDYVRLASEPEALRPEFRGHVTLTRLRCFPGLDLRKDPPAERADHVSLTATMVSDLRDRDRTFDVHAEAKSDIETYIAARRMLGTRFHLVSALDRSVSVAISVLPATLEVQGAVGNAITNYLNPVYGGEDGKGWPLGRNVYASELRARIGLLPEVDEVLSLTLDCDRKDRVKGDWILLEDYEQVSPRVTMS